MSKSDVAANWLGKLTKLNPASGRGACRGKAPHKPLLLLCLIDMAEAGELRGRTFTRTAGLVLRFKSYGGLVVERWPSRLELRMPFFYLRTQGFWQAFTMEMRPAESPESCVVLFGPTICSDGEPVNRLLSTSEVSGRAIPEVSYLDGVISSRTGFSVDTNCRSVRNRRSGNWQRCRSSSLQT